MPPHKLPSHDDDKEETVIALPEIAAGISLPEPEPEPEMNEWERAGVRPPQRYRH